MAKSLPCVLYKETRINTEPSLSYTNSSSSPVITNIRLPSHQSANRLTNAPPRRRSIPVRLQSHSSSPSIIDQRDIEAIFANYTLAKAASIFFRSSNRFPRCLLYRVVEDYEVLEILSMDMVQQGETQAGPAGSSEKAFRPGRSLLRFHFPEKIRESCTAFADAPDKDEVVIYVMTLECTIYTLSLKGEILRSSGGDPGKKASGIGLGPLKEYEYCRTYILTGLSLRPPHCLFAIDHRRILISLQDGELLKLERTAQDVVGSLNTRYLEKTFNDTAGLLGILKSRIWSAGGSVRYKDCHISYSTVISTAIFTPKLGVKDEWGDAVIDLTREGDNLLFTVSVDHTLKVWSLEKGSLLHACDLLNEPTPKSSTMKTLLSPTPTPLLAVIPGIRQEHLFYLVAYSAASTGNFKFWVGLCDESGNFTRLEDLFEGFTFPAMPPTDSSVWMVSDFTVSRTTNEGIYNMWILWKSNTSFKVQNLQFNIQSVPDTWGIRTSSTPDALHVFPSKGLPTGQSEDITDAYMDWVFHPSRFPDSVIEAALDIYEQNFVSLNNTKSHNYMSLQSRVGKVVASGVELQKSKDGNLNFDKYRQQVGLQWDRFVRLCLELDRQRGEALSLAADPVTGYIWVVNADGITAVRECTEVEMINHNMAIGKEMYSLLIPRMRPNIRRQMTESAMSEVLLLVRAASDLINSLSVATLEQCYTAIQEELLQDPMFAVSDRMWNLVERCLQSKVPDNVLDKVDDTFDAMEDPEQAFQNVLAGIAASDDKFENTPLSPFGVSTLVKSTQEVVNVVYSTLFNLSFLLPLVYYSDEGRLSSRFRDPEGLFLQIIKLLREYEVLKWMSRTILPIREYSPEDALTQSLTSLRVTEKPHPDEAAKSNSVLELMGPVSIRGSDHELSRLTSCVRRFISSLGFSDYEIATAAVLARLIVADSVPLAREFTKFLPTTPWGVYLKARVHLRSRSDGEASALFKRAAFGLSMQSPDVEVPAVLIPVVGETETSSFGNGLCQYFMHVAKLHEDSESWGYVVDFCRSAILALDDKNHEEIRMGILSKMFQAALRVSMFDEAYLALMQYPNQNLQYIAVGELVEGMVEQGQGDRLCSYPFIGLQDEVDEALSAKCETMLDVTVGPPFHKVLYAWRIGRGDYRGAATVLYQRLLRLKTANVGTTDPQSKSVTDGYLALLNVLSCVGEDQAWILACNRVEDQAGSGPSRIPGGGDPKRLKIMNGTVSSSKQTRKVITLQDIQNEYQQETDRQGLLLHGGFFV